MLITASFRGSFRSLMRLAVSLILHRFDLREDDVSSPLGVTSLNTVLVSGVDKTQGKRLSCAKFVRIKSPVHVIDRTDRKISSYSKSRRRTLDRQRLSWNQENLHLFLCMPRELSPSESWEIFISLIAPSLLGRGIHPSGIVSYPSFCKALQRGPVILTLNAGELLGVAGFEISRLILNDGKIDTIAVGTFHASTQSLKKVSRWWMFQMRSLWRSVGVGWFSYGGDDAWIDSRYANVIIDKLRWGSALATAETGLDIFFRSGNIGRSGNRRWIVLPAAGECPLVYSERGWISFEGELSSRLSLLPIVGQVQKYCN